MDGYSSIDEYPWPDDIYDEDGQVNMERFMELLESEPELMQQFQCTVHSACIIHTIQTI